MISAAPTIMFGVIGSERTSAPSPMPQIGRR